MKNKLRFLTLLTFSTLSLATISACATEEEPIIPDDTKAFNVVFSDDFKFDYILNETITYKGLSVFDKVSNQEITDYYISPNEGMRLRTPGKVEVTISKDTYEDYVFTINVENDGTYVETQQIDLYSVNDFHGSFLENGSEIGMSKLGAFLKDQKDNDAIILSAGDMWQGGVESNLTQGKIVVDAMNEIGFDAMTVGNHEFDWGLDVLEENINLMEFPMLAANGYEKETNTRFSFFKPYTIVEKNGVKVGIIGTGAESLPTDITYSVSQYLDFKEQIPIIKLYSDELKIEHDCDAVILLAHDGGCYNYEGDPYLYEEVCEVSSLSNETYVDGIFLGHDHDEKSGKYKDIPYAEGGSNGEYVSHIVLNFEKVGDDYQIVKSDVETISTAYSGRFDKEDDSITALLDKYADELAQADRVICTFTSYKSRNDILDLVCDAMIAYANDPKHESILIDDQKVTAAFHNTGGVRDSADSGDFTYRDLIKVLPFDNTYCIAKLTDQQFDTWNNSSNYYKGSKGSGKYTYVATINYLADNPDYSPSEKVFNTNIVIQDIFIEYLEANDGSF